ncbi:aldehyde dehydrogenase family protein [Conexibacter sp. SYSU D00693]|uniref:aldehyde dehydrogenase family protein n=1 Tax=Conexibacter sp. SYSU D00693 TaxID=2812560 RepID=UPI00196A8BC4|nr:aldehyde dehydrogenase family protein [Conexibacter sp. SYSU D00693]
MSLATSTIVDRDQAAASDAPAIERLQESLALQRAAFRKDPIPTKAQRVEHLQALAGMLVANRARIEAAVAEDFGAHPALFCDLLEVLGPAGRAVAAIEALDDWMAAEQRAADPALWGDARVEMRLEPKGVIGNMAPWNFPFEIGCGPVVEMLAAGNRVVVKPSDLTPACAALLEELVAQTFDRDRVTTAVGGLELARAFTRQPWDHLMYTGSPGVGREVMRAAAEHLVPVTLELGGKCPAVLTASGVTREAVASILGTKLVKNGQMCITVDHVLVPRDRLEDLVDLLVGFARDVLPGHSTTADAVGLITDRHLARIEAMLDEAREAGARIVELEPGTGVDRATRRMPLSLVVDPPAGLRLMQEEVFGPLLPVIPYDDLDEALAAIDAQDRPLGLYVFGDDAEECEHVVRTVRSGGACINGCALQGAVASLGFGGSGTSGMGRHHGIEGFREFSTARGVVVRGTHDDTDVLFPPYGAKAQAVVDAALGG